ncbi:MAG: hypothetical protein RIA71_02190 [Oceanicaulis sp.]
MSVIAAAAFLALAQAQPAPQAPEPLEPRFNFEGQASVFMPTGAAPLSPAAGAGSHYGLHDQASVFIDFGPNAGLAGGGASGAWVTPATAMGADINAMRSRVLVTRFGDSLAIRNQTIEDCGDVNIGSIVADRVSGRAETNVVLQGVTVLNTGRCER